MNLTSFDSEISKTDTITIELKDTIPDKILKIYKDKSGCPVKYSREIVTGICIDGECRLVAINLFWNITGRYLGFELPENEFLSKTKHKQFKPKEYDRLHEILTEANSPLIDYTIEELVPVKDSYNQKVDAITSATITAVLNYIVEGAVYTTYTLYQIVYGPTKHEIEKQTSKLLNSELTLKILNSNNIKDQVWVLNNISAEMGITLELQNKLMELISGKDIYLAERSINALKPEVITSKIQLELAKIFQNSGFLQKRLIIQKLKKTDTLNPDAVAILSTELNNLNGTLTKSVLELYNIQSVADDFTITEVTKLLKNENRYISNQALRYLKSVENMNKKTEKAIEKFQKNNS